MSAPWVVAVVVLWVVVLFLGVLVLGVLRRVTTALNEIGEQNASVADMDTLVKGLPVGGFAPQVSAADRHGEMVKVVTPGMWSVVTLVRVDCAHCTQLIEEFGSGVDQPVGMPSVFVIEDTDDARRLTAAVRIPVLFQKDDEVSRAFNTTATPYAFVIDPQGRVRDRGHPNSAAELVALADRAFPIVSIDPPPAGEDASSRDTMVL